MRCPTLSELPPPLPGKTGWPWTEESPQLPDTMPDSTPWPRISIVTPSYNQGHFIEETIRSVLLQGYPDLEYIIMDGKSTDNTVEIIQEYERWLSYWVSERDRGQADAIARGFCRASGQIEAYLNSDDIFFPSALCNATRAFIANPDAMWLAGSAIFFETSIAAPIGTFDPGSVHMPAFLFGQSIAQPSTFWRSEAEREVGFDGTYQFCMDTALFAKLADRYGQPAISRLCLAGCRLHPESKTSIIGYLAGVADIERLAREWTARYGSVKRLLLKHHWNTWKIRRALSACLEASEESRGKMELTAMRLSASYIPGIFNRQALGALRRIISRRGLLRRGEKHSRSCTWR